MIKWIYNVIFLVVAVDIVIAGSNSSRSSSGIVVKKVLAKASWLKELGDRLKYNAEMQKILYNHHILNYKRNISARSENVVKPTTTILLWITEGLEDMAADPDAYTQGCPVPCILTTNRLMYEQADLIATMGVAVPPVFRLMHPWQRRAIIGLTPDTSNIGTTIRLGVYYSLVSYSRHAEVQFDFRPQSFLIDLKKQRSKSFNLTNSFIPLAIFSDDCATSSDGRFIKEYLASLSKILPVHFYGQCLNTHSLNANETISDAMGRYHFSLVAESHFLDDYVTAPIYDALGSDTVPIYMGAPNISDYLPVGQQYRMILQARHYPDPAALAEKLVTLLTNPAQYKEMMEWRSERLKFPHSRGIYTKGPESIACRMCQYHREHLDA